MHFKAVEDKKFSNLHDILKMQSRCLAHFCNLIDHYMAIGILSEGTAVLNDDLGVR